jgi:hypothetical protein
MRRVPAVCLLALLAGGTAAGCAQDGDASSSASSASSSAASSSTSSSASSSASAVCSSVDDLQGSMSDLKAVPVVDQGVDALQGAFASVRSDVSQVVDDAQAQHSAQADTLTAGVTAVQTAIDQAQAGPTRATLSAVVDSIGALADDVTTFAGDVSSTC